MIILLTSTKQYQQTACKIAGGFSFAEDLDIQIYKTSLHYVSVTLKDKIKSMEIQKRSGLKIEMIAELINSVVRGWMNYFLSTSPPSAGGEYPQELWPVYAKFQKYL